MKRTAALLLAALGLAGACPAADAAPGKASPALLADVVSRLHPPFVNGFASPVDGETIRYHSSNDFAREALLARASDGRSPIAWRSDPLPAGRRPLVLAWLAGVSTNLGPRRFTLSLNGEKWLHFSNPASAADARMTVSGPRGSTLTFVAERADVFGDLFGYMFLQLPAGLFPPGQPLELRIDGEAAGSRSWVMAFRHPLRAALRVRPLPVLTGPADAPRQSVQVAVEHYDAPCRADIRLHPGTSVSLPLPWGLTVTEFPVTETKKKETRRVTVRAAGRLLHEAALELRPVTRRRLVLLPHSHTDIGYSAHQEKVEADHLRYIDEALDLAERTAAYPPGAGFKWNIEVLWPLDAWLRRAAPAQRERLFAAVRDGRIGLNGLYANLLTGLCRPEELLQATALARRAGAAAGAPVTTAMLTDIPSYSAGLLPALALSGIRYFSSGPNYMPSLPDGGDRIGATLKTWGDRPVWWEPPSGRCRVLFWMAGRGYSWFHGLNAGPLPQAPAGAIYDYLDELERSAYPYDMVQVRYTIGGDNGPPDPQLPDFVRAWNDAHLSPRFEIATAAEMFAEFESRFGDGLPVVRGDLTPHWEDGAASTARELALNRQAAERLVQAATLFALLAPGRYRPDDFAAAWRQVVLFDEHTWGAADSVSAPDDPGVKAQWEYKRAIIEDGARRADALLEGALGPPATGAIHALDVVNTHSWPRTGLVFVPAGWALAGERVKDDAGRPCPAQRLGDGRLAVLVRGVRPFGARRLFFHRGAPHPPRDPGPAVADGERMTLSNGRVWLQVDPGSGDISRLIVDGVDYAGRPGLNGYRHVAGFDPATARTDGRARVTVGERGPLVASLVVDSEAPGLRSLRREVMLAGNHRLRVFIQNTLDVPQQRDKESVHFAFPFRLPGATLRVDSGWEKVSRGLDQLPGSCFDFFCVQRWASLEDEGGGVGMALVPLDAPLLETGAMTDETRHDGVRRWRERPADGETLYSYALNNYWHTNYKADQPGRVLLRYVLVPFMAGLPATAARAGAECSQPLQLRPAHGPRPPAAPLEVDSGDPATVLATSLTPCADGGGLLLRLQNAGDEPAPLTLRWLAGGRAAFRASDVNEARGPEIAFPRRMEPGEILTVRIERENP